MISSCSLRVIFSVSRAKIKRRMIVRIVLMNPGVSAKAASLSAICGYNCVRFLYVYKVIRIEINALTLTSSFGWLAASNNKSIFSLSNASCNPNIKAETIWLPVVKGSALSCSMPRISSASSLFRKEDTHILLKMRLLNASLSLCFPASCSKNSWSCSCL